MDWIERVVHISPDGGDGSVEFSIIVGGVIALALIATVVVKVKLRPISQYWRRRMISWRRRTPRGLLDRFDG